MIERSGRPITAKSLIGLTVLIVAGILGNYFTIPLFFGADFLFGSVAVLLVIWYYGFIWGLVAAIIVHSYTFFLWGHPYGVINFVSEALFVGYFLRRRQRNLLALDWLFWVLLGMPLAWFYHGVVMHMSVITASFIMLKQAVNGIFDAMLASLAISHLPLDRLLLGRRLWPKISLQTSLFNMLVLMVLVPALFLTMLQVKQEKANLEAGVMTELQSLSANVQLHLSSWHQRHLQALQVLASAASGSSMVSSEQLQHEMEILKQSCPDFSSMHIEDADGRSIIFDPKVNERGETTAGANFSDRGWFQDVKAKQQPVVSEVIMGRTAVFSPLVTFVVPVIKDNRWLGCATGSLDLTHIQKILKLYQSNQAAASLTLTDPKNQIIASTDPKRAPMQSWNWRESGQSRPLDRMMNLWSPDDMNLPSMTRWRQSYYLQETSPGPELPWKLTAQAPVAPLQSALYTVYVKNLAIMVCLITLGLFLSYIFSRRLTQPLAKLAQVSVDIPEKLLRSEEIDWPAGSAEELDLLVDNFMSMAKTLEANFHRLQVQSDGLRQTAEALSIRESYLTAIIENQPGLLWLKDTKGRFLAVNHAFARSCGREKSEDLVGKTDLDVWPEELAEKYRSDDREVMAERRPTAVEERIFDQGVVQWFQTFKTPVFSADGQVLGTCGFALNITERRRMEEGLREAERRYRTLFEGANDATFIMSPEGFFIECNETTLKIFGCEEFTDIVGHTPWEFSPARQPDGKDSKVKALEMINAAVGGKPRHFYWQHVRKDRTPFDAEVSLNNITLENKVLVQALVRDITERKQAEEERERLLEQLNRAKKMEALGTLAGGIAHDFNNILGIIFGFTELAHMDAGDQDRVRESLREVSKAGKRAKDLVQQILTFSRQVEHEKRPVEVGSITSEALKMLRSSLPTTVEIKQDVASRAVVSADPTQIHQVLMNLCTNAAHAMFDGGGVLEVSLTDLHFEPGAIPPHLELQPGPYVNLTVKDTGHGIEPAIMERIFDPFFTTKEVGKGTGLGLPVVHGIVKDLGGSIHVESSVGKGTTFQVLLPVIETPAVASTERREQLLRGRERVLVVDDEPALTDAIQQMLEHLGYEVECRSNGLEALQAIRGRNEDKSFDLVITDMTMPQMTGTDLVRELAKVRPGLPIILCTGFSEKVDAEKAKSLGVQGFLMKPVVLKDLANMVRRVLDKEN